MEITSVHYQRLINLGDYENERCGAWANVGADETPEDAYAALHDWVDSNLNLEREAQQDVQLLQNRKRALQNELSQLTVEIAEMRTRWEAAKRFVTGLGLEIPPSRVSDDDIPF